MSTQPVARQLAPEDVEVRLSGSLPLGVAEYAGRKVAHVGRLAFAPVERATVVVRRSADPARSNPVTAEVTLLVGGARMRAEAEGARPREAVDRVVDRLERLVVRLGERWHDRSRWPGLAAVERARATASRPRRRVDEPEVVRRKTFAVAPQSVDEAAFDLEALGHDFHLYVDTETGGDALLHRRDDGRYGVQGVRAGAGERTGVVREPAPAQLDEAAARARLDAGGEPLVFFVDAGTGRGNVLYRRADGNYGLITPA